MSARSKYKTRIKNLHQDIESLGGEISSLETELSSIYGDSTSPIIKKKNLNKGKVKKKTNNIFPKPILKRSTSVKIEPKNKETSFERQRPSSILNSPNTRTASSFSSTKSLILKKKGHRFVKQENSKYLSNIKSNKSELITKTKNHNETPDSKSEKSGKKMLNNIDDIIGTPERLKKLNLFDRSVQAIERKAKIQAKRQAELDEECFPRHTIYKPPRNVLPLKDRIFDSTARKIRYVNEEMRKRELKEQEECTFQPTHYTVIKQDAKAEHIFHKNPQQEKVKKRHYVNYISKQYIENAGDKADFYFRNSRKEVPEEESPVKSKKFTTTKEILRLSRPRPILNEDDVLEEDPKSFTTCSKNTLDRLMSDFIRKNKVIDDLHDEKVRNESMSPKTPVKSPMLEKSPSRDQKSPNFESKTSNKTSSPYRTPTQNKSNKKPIKFEEYYSSSNSTNYSSLSSSF